MSQNLKNAVRSLVNRPGFTALVVLITGLCIGGNTSVFSAAKAVLFQDLPYPNAERIVQFHGLYLPTTDANDLSYPDIVEFRQRSTLIEDISPFLPRLSRLLRVGDANERIGVEFTSSAHWRLLDVRPHLGRLFLPEEDVGPGSAPVTILSYELWERHFASDPEVLGKPVQMDGNTYTVVGILPPRFFDIAEGTWDVDAWLPAVMVGDVYPNRDANTAHILERRNSRIWTAIGRLKPGVSQAEALEELKAISAHLATEYPDTNEGYGVTMMPLRRYMFGDLFPSLRMLLTGAVLILCIGCANIAGLLLVRVVERRNELAMRLALGASRAHLVRQVFLESLILALVGGALGVALAFFGIRLLSRWVVLPIFARMELDGVMLGVVLLVSTLTGILFSLPPAIGAARMELRSGLLQRNRNALGSGLQGSRGRSLLVVFQVAVVTILLLVAGLLLRSFLQLHNTDVDFNTERLLTLRMSFTTENYQERTNISVTERELLERLQEVPGVESVVVWGPGIPGLYTLYMEIQPEGASDPENHVRASFHSVSPGALKSLGIPVLQGRELRPTDTSDTQRVAVISRSLAEGFWPGEDPIGKRLQRLGRPDEAIMEVVGVIPNCKLSGRHTDGTGQLIVSHEQRPIPDTTLVVRTAAAPESVVDPLRDAIRRVDPDIPAYDISTLEELFRNGERFQRLNAAVVGMYGTLALIFAVLGLYGTLAYSVLQRTQEIGVRVAFGARPGDIRKMIIGRGLVLVGAGMAIGLIGALGVTRLLTGLLFGITKHDPITYVGVVVVLTIMSVVSTLMPARRALRLNPTDALRFE